MTRKMLFGNLWCAGASKNIKIGEPMRATADNHHAEGICMWLDRQARLILLWRQRLPGSRHKPPPDLDEDMYMSGLIFVTSKVVDLLGHLFETLLDAESEGRLRAKSFISDWERRNLQIATDRFAEHYSALNGVPKHGQQLSREELEDLLERVGWSNEAELFEWADIVLASVIQIRDDIRERHSISQIEGWPPWLYLNEGGDVLTR